MWIQKNLRLRARGRGCHLITEEIISQIPELRRYSVGLANIFLQHTSASLTLNENDDPDVRRDMEMVLDRIAPETAPYTHTMEVAMNRMMMMMMDVG